MTQNQKQWGQRIGEFDIFWTIHHGVYIRKKIPIRKFKRQRTNLRKVFATHIRHQGLMSLIFKELLSYLERNSLQKITKHLQNWNENDLQHRKEMFRLPHRKRTASLTCIEMRFSPFRYQKSESWQHTRVVSLWGKNAHSYIFCSSRPLWRSIWQYLAKLNIHLSFDPIGLFLEIYLRDSLIKIQKYVCIYCSILCKAKD